MKQEPVSVQGVWLRRIGNLAEVLVEVDGKWILIIREVYDGAYSHIMEPNGIRSAITRHEEAGEETNA